jgi:predicted PurR-regulated permease PerM
MTNKLAWAVLIGVLIGSGWLFFQVVRPFLTPLFLAAILAVLFRPVFDYVRTLLGGHQRIAAFVTTLGIVVLILLPVGGGLVLAGQQLVDLAASWSDPHGQSRIASLVSRLESTPPGVWLQRHNEKLTHDQQEKLNAAASSAASAIAKDLSEKTLKFVADFIAVLLGFAIMGLALYYFFSDGQRLLLRLQRLSPLPDEDELALWGQFESLSRSVVLGTIVAGLGQAILAGIGFAAVGAPRVWLLAALTWLTSLIPFVGAASVWVCVCIGLVLDERYMAAALLALYGSLIVSTSDNLIRAYIVGEESSLHPLIVLISSLGAIQFIGLWGIFAGPMIAAFFYSLLCILQKRTCTPVRRKKRKRRRPQVATISRSPTNDNELADAGGDAASFTERHLAVARE